MLQISIFFADLMPWISVAEKGRLRPQPEMRHGRGNPTSICQGALHMKATMSDKMISPSLNISNIWSQSQKLMYM